MRGMPSPDTDDALSSVECPSSHPHAIKCACEGACDGSYFGPRLGPGAAAPAYRNGTYSGNVCFSHASKLMGSATALLTCSRAAFGRLRSVASRPNGDSCVAADGIGKGQCAGLNTASCPVGTLVVSCSCHSLWVACDGALAEQTLSTCSYTASVPTEGRLRAYARCGAQSDGEFKFAPGWGSGSADKSLPFQAPPGITDSDRREFMRLHCNAACGHCDDGLPKNLNATTALVTVEATEPPTHNKGSFALVWVLLILVLLMFVPAALVYSRWWRKPAGPSDQESNGRAEDLVDGPQGPVPDASAKGAEDDVTDEANQLATQQAAQKAAEEAWRTKQQQRMEANWVQIETEVDVIDHPERPMSTLRDHAFGLDGSFIDYPESAL